MKKHIGRRIAATILDYGVYWVLAFVYLFIFGSPNEQGNLSVEGVAGLPLIVAWFVYFPGLESLLSATPGHIVVGLKVVRLDGRRIGLAEALKRRLCDLIDLLFLGILAFIVVRSTQYGQRIGDLAARTRVVLTAEEISEAEHTTL